MEDKKNEIIAQGNQAAPLITDMLANEVILEIELPAQKYIQYIIYSATREAIDITSYIKGYDVILQTDIRKIKAIKISDATDKMKYVILNLISASSIYLDRGEKTNVKFIAATSDIMTGDFFLENKYLDEEDSLNNTGISVWYDNIKECIEDGKSSASATKYQLTYINNEEFEQKKEKFKTSGDREVFKYFTIIV